MNTHSLPATQPASGIRLPARAILPALFIGVAACAALLGSGILGVMVLPSPVAAQPPGGVGPGIAKDPAPSSPSAPPAAANKDSDKSSADDDQVRKAEIMNSERWRRAIFELGEWLSAQEIYTPHQVRTIKADFNRKVAKMSSHDLEYLLDDLDAKFKIIDTPEARDARSWLGQYLSVMSDQKRAEVLKDMPNVVSMTAGQLEQEIQKLEQKRSSLQRQQAAFDEGRQQLVQQAQLSREQTAQASAAAMRSSGGGASYSPYRGSGGGGKPPFSDAGGSGMTLYSGPFGAGVSMSIGNF